MSLVSLNFLNLKRLNSEPLCTFACYTRHLVIERNFPMGYLYRVHNLWLHLFNLLCSTKKYCMTKDHCAKMLRHGVGAADTRSQEKGRHGFRMGGHIGQVKFKMALHYVSKFSIFAHSGCDPEERYILISQWNKTKISRLTTFDLQKACIMSWQWIYLERVKCRLYHRCFKWPKSVSKFWAFVPGGISEPFVLTLVVIWTVGTFLVISIVRIWLIVIWSGNI